MLLTIQFPIADARAFVPGAPTRLDRPDWKTHRDIERHFVRSFGKVSQRLRGGHVFWRDEWFYASARRALAFDNLGKERIGVEGPLSPGIFPQCAFRRLFCDEAGSVIRFEIGLRSLRHRRYPVLTSAGCESLARQALNLKVRVAGHGTTEEKQCRLRDLPGYLARLYEHASVQRPIPKTWQSAGKFVLAGRPILFLEYEGFAISDLPACTRERPILPELVSGSDLAFMWHYSEGLTYPLWFLRSDASKPEVTRRIRLGLLRLHAEYQVLRQVIHLSLNGALEYKRGTLAADNFDAYLRHATRYLTKPKRGNVQLREIQDVIAAESLVASEEVGQLRQWLKSVQIRRNIASNVASYAEARSHGPLDGPKSYELRQVLIELFPNHKQLEMLVNDSLSMNLAVVAAPGNLQKTAFELVQWLGSNLNARLRPFLDQALQLRPNSIELETLRDKIFGSERGLMNIDGKKRREIREALIEAFPLPTDLRMLTDDVLNTPLQNITGLSNDQPTMVFDLIGWAQARGYLTELVIGAAAINQRSASLNKLVNEFKFVGGIPGEVERINLKDVPFENVGQWLEKMSDLRRTVCRIEHPDTYGTGFLVAPDTLMTNFHVIEPFVTSGSETVIIRFDYETERTGATPAQGRTCKLATQWRLLDSPVEELDFALLRLAEPVGGDEIAGKKRGYLRLAPKALSPGSPLIILQHPNAQPLKLAIGSIVKPDVAPNRVSYTVNTEPGSSGSPCFTTGLDLVALHHWGGAPNRGVQLSGVLQFLTARKASLEAMGLSHLLV